MKIFLNKLVFRSTLNKTNNFQHSNEILKT